MPSRISSRLASFFDSRRFWWWFRSGDVPGAPGGTTARHRERLDEAVRAADPLARGWTAPRTLPEELRASDAASALSGHARAAADEAHASTALGADHGVELDETVRAADSLRPAGNRHRQVALSSGGLARDAVRLSGRSERLAEAVRAAGGLTYHRTQAAASAHRASVADAALARDSFADVLEHFHEELFDRAAASDAAAPASVLPRGASDSARAGDGIGIDRDARLADGARASGAVARAAGFGPALADGARTTGTTRASIDSVHHLHVSETAHAEDAADRPHGTLRASAADSAEAAGSAPAVGLGKALASSARAEDAARGGVRHVVVLHDGAGAGGAARRAETRMLYLMEDLRGRDSLRSSLTRSRGFVRSAADGARADSALRSDARAYASLDDRIGSLDSITHADHGRGLSSHAGDSAEASDAVSAQHHVAAETASAADGARASDALADELRPPRRRPLNSAPLNSHILG